MDVYFYLLTVEGDTEPSIEGPFATETERDEAAREYRRAEFDGGIFPLNISADVEPTVEIDTYSGGFFEEEWKP